MVYLIDALALAWIASIWSKEGLPNIAIAMIFVTLAVVNAIGSAPVVTKFVGF